MRAARGARIDDARLERPLEYHDNFSGLPLHVGHQSILYGTVRLAVCNEKALGWLCLSESSQLVDGWAQELLQPTSRGGREDRDRVYVLSDCALLVLRAGWKLLSGWSSGCGGC